MSVECVCVFWGIGLVDVVIWGCVVVGWCLVVWLVLGGVFKVGLVIVWIFFGLDVCCFGWCWWCGSCYSVFLWLGFGWCSWCLVGLCVVLVVLEGCLVFVVSGLGFVCFCGRFFLCLLICGGGWFVLVGCFCFGLDGRVVFWSCWNGWLVLDGVVFVNCYRF